MNMYDIIFESICEQYEDGYLTFKEAELLNDVAYERYNAPGKLDEKLKRDIAYYGSTDSDAKREKRLEHKKDLPDNRKSIEFDARRKKNRYWLPDDEHVDFNTKKKLDTYGGMYNPRTQKGTLVVDRVASYVPKGKISNPKYAKRRKEILTSKGHKLVTKGVSGNVEFVNAHVAEPMDKQRMDDYYLTKKW